MWIVLNPIDYYLYSIFKAFFYSDLFDKGLGDSINGFRSVVFLNIESNTAI